MSCASSLLVLSNAAIVKRVTSFQSGIPLRLGQFWCECEPDPAKRQQIDELPALIVRHAHVDLLNLLLRRPVWIYETNSTLKKAPMDEAWREAIRCGRVDVLQWLIEQNVEIPVNPSLWISAIASFQGDFTILDLLKSVCRDDIEELRSARSQSIIGFTVKDVALVEWIHLNLTIPLPCSLMDAAAGRGDLPMLKFLHKHRKEGCTSRAYEVSWSNQHIEALLFLLENRPEPWSQTFVELVAEAGDVDTLKLLLKRSTELPPVRSEWMDRLAMAGQLAGLQFLYDHTHSRCTTSGIDGALSNAHLAVAQFLHKRGTIIIEPSPFLFRPFSPVAMVYDRVKLMEQAASRGDLSSVRFICEELNVTNASARALYFSARHGHLDVVKYLHENCTEVCSHNVLEAAAETGQLEVVSYLLQTSYRATTKITMSSCCPPGSEPARATSPHDGEVKQFGQTSLYVAGPATAKVGVLAFPDIYGWGSGHTKQDADRLGQEGYAVVLVDLTKGDYIKESDEVGDVLGGWLAQTDYNMLVKPSIDDAIAYLKQVAQVEHIVSYGYCYGAWVGARLATESPSPIKGNVSFHPSWLIENMVSGGPGTVEKLAEAINAPQLVLSASNDPENIRPGGSVEKILKAKPDVSVLSEVADFEYVKHGWVNRGDLSDDKVKATAEDAWRRARAFFTAVTTQ
ncbi:hypothetical protein Poli38472_012648 [Pythium oligandrum]|uniref:Dienelactone hydrolase domain-containing protein n=1 Tax=Pythium oligandrum TaxID=41045 RepID=A0A8K1FJ59_PYTOL|nr:hypothetical protein Poli38472_012648 [Pythium oligandrum]|eukprot:TMW61457.1 hypothetical protein Poli38472_012648 [Pythium oligandrum]